MAEFIDRYDGDLQAALRGVQKERLERMGTALSTDLDRTERKRKWISSFDIPDPGEGESSNAVKFRERSSSTPNPCLLLFKLVWLPHARRCQVHRAVYACPRHQEPSVLVLFASSLAYPS